MSQFNTYETNAGLYFLEENSSTTSPVRIYRFSGGVLGTYISATAPAGTFSARPTDAYTERENQLSAWYVTTSGEYGIKTINTSLPDTKRTAQPFEVEFPVPNRSTVAGAGAYFIGLNRGTFNDAVLTETPAGGLSKVAEFPGAGGLAEPGVTTKQGLLYVGGNGKLYVFGAASGLLRTIDLAAIGGVGIPWKLFVTPDDATLIIGAGGHVFLLDLRNANAVPEMLPNVSSLRFCYASGAVYTADGKRTSIAPGHAQSSYLQTSGTVTAPTDQARLSRLSDVVSSGTGPLCLVDDVSTTPTIYFAGQSSLYLVSSVR